MLLRLTDSMRRCGNLCPTSPMILFLVAFSPTLLAQGTVDTPTYSPAGGTYSFVQNVTISTATSGATIYYTTDGSTPSTFSTSYTGAASVSANTTLKAIAVKSGLTDSGIGTATYAIVVATPTFSPGSGTYSSTQTVTISSSTSGAYIRYTVDGSTPSASAGTVYSGAITISATTTLKAIAYASGLSDSGIATGVYNIVAATPSISSLTPTSGASGVQVTISGSGFGSTQGTGNVWLGSTLAAVVSWSDTQVVATVAANSTSGVAQIRHGSWSNSVSFDVATATITGISPDNGVSGTSVTVTGSGFGSSQGTGLVWLGTANGVVQSWSDTQIVALVASGSLSGSAQVLKSGVLSNAVAFTVNTPQITDVSQFSASPGTSITITGTGFGSSQGTGTVRLGSVAGLVDSWSDTEIDATVASSALTGIVRVQQNGVSSNAWPFTVTGGTATTVTPNLLNMVVGDTHTIQALDSSSQPITGLTWTSSDTAVVSLSSDDPPILSALTAGHVTITAGTATADVTVSSGVLPVGTILWSVPGDGSFIYSMVPAVPSVTGVADMFAFQGDSTVQAITADGTTAWAAAFDPNYGYPIPDFLGGLVGMNGQSGDPASVIRIDGITGASQTVYTPSAMSSIFDRLLVHTDGTIFALQSNNAASSRCSGCIDPLSETVVGIDPSGGQKFSAAVSSSCILPFTIPQDTFMELGSIVAGDGYYYLAYACREFSPAVAHLMLLRVGSNGESTNIHVGDWPDAGGDLIDVSARMITNADTGVALIWRSPGQTSMAITSGTDVSVTNGPEVSGQSDGEVIEPVLQAEDGSFIGTVPVGDYYTPYMVAFDQTGHVSWTVPNERPQIAVADGGVIGQSGITYDQNGNAIGQTAPLPIYSWNGNAYQQTGSVEQISANLLFDLFDVASSFWPNAGGNYSGNQTADAVVRTFADNEASGSLVLTNSSQSKPQPANHHGCFEQHQGGSQFRQLWGL